MSHGHAGLDPRCHAICEYAEKLTARPHEVWRSSCAPPASTDDDRTRLRHLEEQLDQCWDMLRQRRAKAEFDQPADDVRERPVGEVESYLQ